LDLFKKKEIKNIEKTLVKIW